MSFVKIWIHAVWSTKNKKPLILSEFRSNIYKHIIENAKDKGILIDSVGGYHDHIHILLRLKNDQTISKVVQLIKGESSFWINRQDFISKKFEWQKEYFAVSIGENDVARIRKYIQNQVTHHKPETYDELYQKFIKKYGLDDNG